MDFVQVTLGGKCDILYVQVRNLHGTTSESAYDTGGEINVISVN